MLTAEQRAAVVAEALSWEGTRWEHAQRVKGAGVDCGMFLLEVYERCGLIPHVEPEPYPHDWHMHQSGERYLAMVEKFCEPSTDRLPGDIATFRWGRCVSHGAIIVEWPIIVHAFLDVGCVIRDDAVANLELAKRLRGTYSVRGAR